MLLQMTPYTKRWYLFVWGAGYVGSETRARIKAYQEDYITEQNGFMPQTLESARELDLGEYLNLNGVTDVLTVVRVV
jgi:hypothetical protein